MRTGESGSNEITSNTTLRGPCTVLPSSVFQSAAFYKKFALQMPIQFLYISVRETCEADVCGVRRRMHFLKGVRPYEARRGRGGQERDPHLSFQKEHSSLLVTKWNMCFTSSPEEMLYPERNGLLNEDVKESRFGVRKHSFINADMIPTERGDTHCWSFTQNTRYLYLKYRKYFINSEGPRI